MNTRLTKLLLLALPFAVALVWSGFGAFAALLFLFLVGSLLLPRNSAEFCDATLILPRILQRVMKAYRTWNLPAKFFMTDVSEEGVKFGQPILAQMPIMPVATAHTPGDDLEADATNVKTLLKDVPMRINQAAKVVLKLPTADAVRLETDAVFEQSIQNSAFALGKYMIEAGLSLFTPTNFTHEIVEPVAEWDKETLSAARIALNIQEAGEFRNALAGSTAMSTLTNDPRIASGDYYGQRVESDPYVTLSGIEGFSQVREFPKFPTANNLLGVAFDQQAILLAVRKLADNFDLARRLGIPVTVKDFTLTDPESGLSFTGYMWMKKNTHDIYVTVVAAFGVVGGTKTFDANGDPDNADANDLLDRSAVRIVSAATA